MKKPIIISAIALLLILIIIFAVIFNNDSTTTPPESPPTSVLEVPSNEPGTVVIEQNPDLIIIDNTPADVYVDIAAGANNPAINLPWAESDEEIACDCCLMNIVAITHVTIDLLEDGVAGFTWNEILQVEPPTLRITDEIPEKLQSIPRRQIQNRDAARVVANEMLSLLDYSNRELSYIRHDPAMNIWFFSYSVVPLAPSWSITYAVNGYNGQVIRSWVE